MFSLIPRPRLLSDAASQASSTSNVRALNSRRGRSIQSRGLAYDCAPRASRRAASPTPRAVHLMSSRGEIIWRERAGLVEPFTPTWRLVDCPDGLATSYVELLPCRVRTLEHLHPFERGLHLIFFPG